MLSNLWAVVAIAATVLFSYWRWRVDGKNAQKVKTYDKLQQSFEKAKQAENEVAGLSDDAVSQRLRDKWTR